MSNHHALLGPFAMIGDEPVIGSLVNTPLYCDMGVLVEVSSFAYTYNTNAYNKTVMDWRTRMLDRHWDWLPRYYYELDRNRNGEYKERREMVEKWFGGGIQRREKRTVEQLQCFCPNGLKIPPDGWLMHPYWRDGRFFGQRLIRATGVRWEERGLTRVAWMQLDNQVEFLPLHEYEHIVEALNNRK